jgi:hypothetical protein
MQREQIKGVPQDGRSSSQTLEQVEGGLALFVQRNDLAVNNGVIRQLCGALLRTPNSGALFRNAGKKDNSSIALSANLYAHVGDRLKREAADAMDQVLSRA